MAEENVVVNPPIKTLDQWIGIILVPSLVALPVVWCYWVTAAQGRQWTWVILPIVLWLVGVGFMVALSIGFYGARADAAGLALEKAWNPSSRTSYPWPAIRGLQVAITPEKRRRIRYVARVDVEQEGDLESVECPYDVELCRAIVSRAHLTLRDAPPDWKSVPGAANDPFLALKGLKDEDQQWKWVRREPSSTE